VHRTQAYSLRVTSKCPNRLEQTAAEAGPHRRTTSHTNFPALSSAWKVPFRPHLQKFRGVSEPRTATYLKHCVFESSCLTNVCWCMHRVAASLFPSTSGGFYKMCYASYNTWIYFYFALSIQDRVLLWSILQNATVLELRFEAQSTKHEGMPILPFPPPASAQLFLGIRYAL
jgi:hypothetical protein